LSIYTLSRELYNRVFKYFIYNKRLLCICDTVAKKNFYRLTKPLIIVRSARKMFRMYRKCPENCIKSQKMFIIIVHSVRKMFRMSRKRSENCVKPQKKNVHCVSAIFRSFPVYPNIFDFQKFFFHRE
jgi:hypothetical protein